MVHEGEGPRQIAHTAKVRPMKYDDAWYHWRSAARRYRMSDCAITAAAILTIAAACAPHRAAKTFPRPEESQLTQAAPPWTFDNEKRLCAAEAYRYLLEKCLGERPKESILVPVRDLEVLNRVRALLPTWDFEPSTSGEWVPGVGPRRKVDQQPALYFALRALNIHGDQARAVFFCGMPDPTEYEVKLRRADPQAPWQAYGFRSSPSGDEVPDKNPRPLAY